MAVHKLIHFEKLREILPSLYVGKELNQWEQDILMRAFIFVSVPLPNKESWYQISSYQKNPKPITRHHLNALEEIYDYKYKSYYKQPVSLESYM